MASGRNIKGITVEIGGNVGPLQKALESVNKTIKTTQSELKDIERLLNCWFWISCGVKGFPGRAGDGPKTQ